MTTDASKPEPLPRDCCPICGHQFQEVQDVNVCPTEHYGEQEFTRDELISEDDDYAWCL
jgi:hypothetical protein